VQEVADWQATTEPDLAAVELVACPHHVLNAGRESCAEGVTQEGDREQRGARRDGVEGVEVFAKHRVASTDGEVQDIPVLVGAAAQVADIGIHLATPEGGARDDAGAADAEYHAVG